MKKIKKIVFVAFLLWTVVCGLWTITYAAVPHLINYQGRLTDASGSPLNGSCSLTFRIYDAETAGNLLWEETHQGTVIQKGIFSILLGSVTNLDLPFDKPYFLEIKVGNEVMSPRQAITSAGYAIRAEKAEDVRGSENIFPSSGNVGIGTTSPGAKLEISGEGTLRLSPRASLPSSPTEGMVFYHVGDRKLYVYTGSGGWKMLATVSLNANYPDEKIYTCSGGSGPCNLGTQIHFTWSSIEVPITMNRLRVKYQWKSFNWAHDYYTHNIQVLVNGNPIESFNTHQTDWVQRDNTYDVTSYIRHDGIDMVRIQLTDTSGNEEDAYGFRYVYLEFQ